MKRLLWYAVPCLLLAILGSMLAVPAASQQCTATVNCNNACEKSSICPRPYPPCELYCFAPSQTLTCSGNSNCSVSSNSITCDGVTQTCPTTSQCKGGGAWVQCGSFFQECTMRCAV